MSMLNDRDRDLLKDLERQLEHENPAWVRQFTDFKPPSRARRKLTTIGLLVLLAALCLFLGANAAAVIFGSAAIVAAHIRYHV
jgi:Protein of unknown function (DUF3040)